MKTKIFGPVTADRKKVIKHFVDYVGSYFKFPECSLNIKFVDPESLYGQESKDLKEFHAWMEQNARRKFTLTISTEMDNLKDILLCLGHELVHAKQYLKGELVDLPDGRVKFKGKIYTDWEYGVGYWFSPFELEAYSYEQALYETFILL